jgi:pimeloyl-ACP methyl ester carboxylesterase
LPSVRLLSGNYISYGDVGKGPAVVQIGGAALSKHQFSRLTPMLRKHCRVLDVELPGYGGNESPKHGGTIDGWAQDIVDLIEHLQVGSAFVHGASIGGFIAMSAAVTRPALVAGLIVSSSVLRADRYMKMMRENWEVIALGLGMRHLATTMALASFTPSFVDTDDGHAQIHAMQDAFDAVNPAKFVSAQRDAMNMDLRSLAGRVAVPTLFIASPHDSMYPLYMEPHGTGLGDAQRIIPSSRLHLVEDCGHSFYIERASQCANAIAAFVNESI